jgi:hypothetical protein
VILDDEHDEDLINPEWAIVGKVLAPNTLHVNTIAAALCPAWGNPKGLVINSAGPNIFVAEFGSKADKDRIMDGSIWTVSCRAVLLKDFNADLRPMDMVFDRLIVWARIENLPFRLMNSEWGWEIAGRIGKVLRIEADSQGRCWGNYMCVQVVVDIENPLMRGVTVQSARWQVTEWYTVVYERLSLFCSHCGLIKHSTLECRTLADRESDGRLPYSPDRLCAQDDQKKNSTSSRSEGSSFSSSKNHGEHGRHAEAVGSQKCQNFHDNRSGKDDVSSPNNISQMKANPGKGPGCQLVVNGNQRNKRNVSGQKRKHFIYLPKNTTTPLLLLEGTSAGQSTRVVEIPAVTNIIDSEQEDVASDNSVDANKKMRKGSADQAGAVEQPRRTQ